MSKIENMQEYLDYAFKLIYGKTEKNTKLWTYLFEEFQHSIQNTHIKGIATAINYLKQFDYDQSSKNYPGHSQQNLLNLALERIAFLSLMEKKKFQTIDDEVEIILNKLKIKNFTFHNPNSLDNFKLKEMHKNKHE